MNSNLSYRHNCELCNSKKNVVLISKLLVDPIIWEFLNEYYGRKILRDDMEGGKYEIRRCLECGFIWQACILNNELTGKLYEI